MVAHERLEAWQAAHSLALAVFAASDHWPVAERYVLVSQIRRAALSVPSNIAGGAAKHGPREFARYLNIALGSLAEIHYLLRFARDRGLTSEAEWRHLESLRNQAGKLLYGLYRRVRSSVPC
jgi:four helix bundle protein